jgi:glycine dehydrogenase
VPFLPTHPLHPIEVKRGADGQGIGPISAAPYGSAGILPIPYAYIAMMGASGLRDATSVAVLSANYVAKRLGSAFPVLYTGDHELVAHECILDVRDVVKSAGLSVDDIAKRLIDYGFHAPTMSFPVAGTLMVEPTESEDLGELDRFCNAMLAIRSEIDAVAAGEYPAGDNPLANAPHPARTLVDWTHAYSVEVGCFPSGSFEDKYWPPVGRVDNAYGDRHLVCACPPIDSYA